MPRLRVPAPRSSSVAPALRSAIATALSKGSGNFLADAAGGASDDGDSVSQLH